jgi:glycosyltransferase involved in cell wall biosynthesis
MNKASVDNILMVAAWWPSKEKPTAGLFIREQALAISNYITKVSVIHVSIEKELSSFPFSIKIEERNDHGLRVYHAQIKTPIRKFGIHDFLVKKTFAKVFTISAKSSPPKFFYLNVRDHITKLALEVPAFKILPFIQTEHFSFYHRGFYLLPEKDKRKQKKELIEWFSKPELKAVLPVSEDLKNTLISEFQCDQQKVAVIPNVASKDFYFEKEINNPAKIKAVSFASWDYPKRPDLLFEAASILPNDIKSRLEFHFVGEGPALNIVRESYEKEANNLTIIFHGFQPKKELADICRTSHMMIHPTDAENAPTCISESLSCGVPVLSMAVNGIPEMVDESNGILVPPNDSILLKGGILTMINHLDKFNREEIARKANALYSPETVAKAISLHINKLH